MTPSVKLLMLHTKMIKGALFSLWLLEITILNRRYITPILHKRTLNRLVSILRPILAQTRLQDMKEVSNIQLIWPFKNRIAKQHLQNISQKWFLPLLPLISECLLLDSHAKENLHPYEHGLVSLEQRITLLDDVSEKFCLQTSNFHQYAIGGSYFQPKITTQ